MTWEPRMEKYIHVDRCDSTQDLLKEQLTQDSSCDYTVSCDFQTHGRGRGENIWEDSAGTICFSMTIRPHLIPSFTALELSVLICRFFKQKNVSLKLKWPNDILTFDEKKCAGILVQSHQGHWLAGIGVNLFDDHQHFGCVFSTILTLKKSEWAKNLAQFIRKNRIHSTDEIKQEWLLHCAHIDKEVVITEGDKKIQGVFKGLGPYGEAMLTTSQGDVSLFNGSLRLI